MKLREIEEEVISDINEENIKERKEEVRLAYIKLKAAEKIFKKLEATYNMLLDEEV